MDLDNTLIDLKGNIGLGLMGTEESLMALGQVATSGKMGLRIEVTLRMLRGVEMWMWM